MVFLKQVPLLFSSIKLKDTGIPIFKQDLAMAHLELPSPHEQKQCKPDDQLLYKEKQFLEGLLPSVTV